MANYLKTATVSAILTLEEHGWSQRRIAKRLGIHRDTVGRYIHSFGKDPKPVNASTHSIDQDPQKAGPESQCKAFRKVIQDKLRSGLSRRRIYQDLRDEYAFEGSCYSVRRFVKRLISTRFAKSLLEEITEAGNTLQSETRNLQNRITTYLTESNKKNSGGSESLNPWLRQLLFQNGIPEELQAIFSHEEVSILRRLLASKSRKHRKQAATIILRKKGFSFKAIGRILSSSRETVAKYWHKYEERGMNAIITHTKRQRKADIEALRETVFALLHSPPSSHGVNRTTWTMKALQNVLKSKGSPACTHVIREIIKSAGYKWRKAKVVLTSNDPEYREKLNHIQSILSSLGRNDRFFSIDEFGPFAVKMKGGKRLVAPGEHPHIPQFQTSKGCLIITAALELSGISRVRTKVREWLLFVSCYIPCRRSVSRKRPFLRANSVFRRCSHQQPPQFCVERYLAACVGIVTQASDDEFLLRCDISLSPESP